MFSTALQTAKTQGATTPPGTGQRVGRSHHHLMDPSGM
jgi:hypothetical protein